MGKPTTVLLRSLLGDWCSIILNHACSEKISVSFKFLEILVSLSPKNFLNAFKLRLERNILLCNLLKFYELKKMSSLPIFFYWHF